MGRSRLATQAETEAEKVRLWWRQRGSAVTEDLQRVAHLQGQLDNTMTQLSNAIAELREIMGDADEEEVLEGGDPDA